jgi:hypothetical protein
LSLSVSSSRNPLVLLSHLAGIPLILTPMEDVHFVHGLEALQNLDQIHPNHALVDVLEPAGSTGRSDDDDQDDDQIGNNDGDDNDGEDKMIDDRPMVKAPPRIWIRYTQITRSSMYSSLRAAQGGQMMMIKMMTKLVMMMVMIMMVKIR